tara:strand:+ start:99 stop:329 length:231 start_codon:yes stop_codon:yes gene_type:complete
LILSYGLGYGGFSYVLDQLDAADTLVPDIYSSVFFFSPHSVVLAPLGGSFASIMETVVAGKLPAEHICDYHVSEVF